MQALIFTAQSGLGLFLGTQLAGVVMDRVPTWKGKFQWRQLWMVPGGDHVGLRAGTGPVLQRSSV